MDREAISSTDETRLEAAVRWTEKQLGMDSLRLSPVSGDASFRRYFRLDDGGQSWVLMDAPPQKEDSRPFVDVARRLRNAGLHPPELLAADLERGFLLLEDLGDGLFQSLVNETTADELFAEAFAVLDTMASRVDCAGLPRYDRNLLVEELELFPRWYLQQHKQKVFSCEEWDLWEALCTRLIRSAQSQPQVFVHRDFHSCNLLKTGSNSPGIIDFQDAVIGPVSYDLISLLWDRYISWPRQRLEGWLEGFRSRLKLDVSRQQWLQECDWMALQRNIKIVGIFARLYYRDGKTGYLEMIPRFWGYVLDGLGRYPEFGDFLAVIDREQLKP